jgi:thioredoxin 1
MIGPAIDQGSQRMNGKIKVARLNVDENQETAMKYGIKSIPSLLLFKKGKEITMTVDAASKEANQKFIEPFLSKI